MNPRKAYPIDPGLIPVYEQAGRTNLGHAFETAVLIEPERRGCEVSYIRTQAGFEVDFFAQLPDGNWALLQVCADLSNPTTRERDVRALLAAHAEYPHATPILLTLDAIPPQPSLPPPLLGCYNNKY